MRACLLYAKHCGHSIICFAEHFRVFMEDVSYHGGTAFLGTTQMVQQKTATRRIMWLHLDRVVKLKKKTGFLVPSPGCNTS